MADLAHPYDGSDPTPQLRELHPLERDILTRILGDLLYDPIRPPRLPFSEMPMLEEMLNVLDPRRGQ